MSLRTRLLIGLVSLVAIGLLLADVATYSSLRSFLDTRTDQQLVAVRSAVLRQMNAPLEGPGGFGPGPRGGRDGRRPPPDGDPASYPGGSYGQVLDGGGGVVQTVWLGEQRTAATLDPPDGNATFDASADGTDYRVRTERRNDGRTLVVAVPLGEMRQTLRRLSGVMIAVGAAVLAALAFTAWWIVRLGMRPLVAIEHTAAEIAAGDLSKRVEPADQRTEVGRLGIALNAMLHQIEEAFEQRKASEDRLRRFLADASHELRTPLTSIRGYAELFRRGADVRPDDLAKSMRRIEEEAERMGVLVEDLLLLARMDEGRPLEREPVDLVLISSDAIADAKTIDPTRTIALDAPEGLVVDADDVRVRQVVANLMNNAISHTPAGSPIEVRVAENGAYAHVSVIDHGPGVDPSEVGRLFERFYRADPSRARDTGGAGLGLAIVAAIAHAHGGDVSVTQTPGGGATFSVRLPR